MRYVAIFISVALGAAAGYAVFGQVADVFPDPRWLPFAAGGGVGAAVFAALYFPLLRHVAEIVGDRLSGLRQSSRATRTGTGLDEIPREARRAAPRLERCRICGLPGKAVCDACAAKLGEAGPRKGAPVRR